MSHAWMHLIHQLAIYVNVAKTTSGLNNAAVRNSLLFYYYVLKKWNKANFSNKIMIDLAIYNFFFSIWQTLLAIQPYVDDTGDLNTLKNRKINICWGSGN